MKSILITGGAGYIGSHIGYLFAQKDYHIVILDTFIHQQKVEQNKATIIQADLADRKILDQIFKKYNIAAVIHCAGSIEVGLSVKDPALFYENNVSKTITLLQTMLLHNVKKIIFSSSCAVYGNPQWLPLTEDHPKDPVSPYGKTKLMIEMILQDFSIAYDFQYVSLRYFNAAGALPEMNLGEQHQPETHIIPLLLQAALENKTFTVFGYDYATQDGTAIRDYLHVLDIAQAHYDALQYLSHGGKSDSFNLGTGIGISINQMIEIVKRITSKIIKIHYVDRRSGDPAILIADATKANKILNWKTQFSDLNSIIKNAYDFEYYCRKTVINSSKQDYKTKEG